MTQTEEKSKRKMPRSKKFRLTNPGQDVIVFVDKNKTFTTSLIVAEKFGKTHAHVLRDIRERGGSEQFNASNFGAVEYVDAKGETRPMYNITRAGCMKLINKKKGRTQ
ncbi:Phage regulatory protein, Rha [Candidatus Magnetobacterium bavaricum]|uniref:Phage regulatory protein, Rha n=1 Tax=Candidatus Magnetobacterium bavaricum TaxID=29290 RepID=A0A0F3GYJ4_9BACT|nr:Phage regulatory protein, Rha [Candidatus Magnetobacterium bavaricum]